MNDYKSPLFVYVSILLSKTTSLDTLQPHSFKIIFISYTLKIIDGKKKNTENETTKNRKNGWQQTIKTTAHFGFL